MGHLPAGDARGRHGEVAWLGGRGCSKGGEAFLVCWLQGGTGGFHASLPRFRNAEKQIRAHIVVVVVSSFFFLIIGGMGGKKNIFLSLQMCVCCKSKFGWLCFV